MQDLTEICAKVARGHWSDGTIMPLVNGVRERDAKLALFADAERALRGIVHTRRFRDNTETGESFAEVSRWSYDAAKAVLARMDEIEPKDKS